MRILVCSVGMFAIVTAINMMYTKHVRRLALVPSPHVLRLAPPSSALGHPLAIVARMRSALRTPRHPWCIGDAIENSYIPECPTIGCERLPNLSSASARCAVVADCRGLVLADGAYEMRAGTRVLESSSNESARPWTCLHLSPDEIVERYVDVARVVVPPRRGTAEEDDSIALSIGAFRDTTCPRTLEQAFSRADRPLKLLIVVVQHVCQRDCFRAEGWGVTRRLVPQADPDVDCVAEFCKGALGRHCVAGRVTSLRLDDADALGVAYTRFLGSLLVGNQTFYMQIDAHTEFRHGWDTDLVRMLRATPSYPRSILSTYPSPGMPSTRDWPRAVSPLDDDTAAPPLCLCTFDRLPASRDMTVRVSSAGTALPRATPPRGLFIAAGFFFVHSDFLRDVPFDPFLPFIFMGEEIMLTARAWTAGYDVYGTTHDVVRHEYVRKYAVKFWETVNHYYGGPTAHNALTARVIRRMHGMLGMGPVAPPLDLALDKYGLGTRRNLSEFSSFSGIDFARHTQDARRVRAWCGN